VTGECVVTDYGLEGGAIYTLSSALRDAIARDGEAVLTIDLIPGSSRAEVAARFSRSRGKRSLATHLKKSLHLGGVKALLLREAAGEGDLADPERAATLIKALPLRLVAPRPIAEAISSAGGVAWSELDERLMLRRLPGVFCTGEMLDWEAPTGGYLLTASLALGRAAGRGVAEWLDAK
jgi:predicted flavoprotein YhiN